MHFWPMITMSKGMSSNFSLNWAMGVAEDGTRVIRRNSIGHAATIIWKLAKVINANHVN